MTYDNQQANGPLLLVVTTTGGAGIHVTHEGSFRGGKNQEGQAARKTHLRCN